jgi:hypothetical protein
MLLLLGVVAGEFESDSDVVGDGDFRYFRPLAPADLDGLEVVTGIKMTLRAAFDLLGLGEAAGATFTGRGRGSSGEDATSRISTS